MQVMMCTPLRHNPTSTSQHPLALQSEHKHWYKLLRCAVASLGSSRMGVAEQGQLMPGAMVSHRRRRQQGVLCTCVKTQPEPALAGETRDVADCQLKHQAFVSWLVTQGVQGIGQPGGLVQLQEIGQGERGLVCIQALHKGDVVLRIPGNLLLTDQVDDKASKALPKDAGAHLRLASRLLREMDKGEKSLWYPYLTSLPKTVCCMATLFQSPSSLAALETDYMSQALDKMRALAREMYDSCPPAARAGASYERFEWACMIASSRMLSTDWRGAPASSQSSSSPWGKPIRCLIPLLDMVNHGPEPGNVDSLWPDTPTANIRWSLQPAAVVKGAGFGSKRPKQPSNALSEWEVHVAATQDIKPGQQLLLCYKPQAANDAFLMHYGFLPGWPLPGANQHDEVVLFQGGMQEALNWHCQQFVVKDNAGLPLLRTLSDDQVLSVYQEAYDVGMASVRKHHGSRQQGLGLMKAGGHAPPELLDAFAAVVDVSKRILLTEDAPSTAPASTSSMPNPTTSQHPPACASRASSGHSSATSAAASAGSRVVHSSGTGGASQLHAEAAVAQVCLLRLKSRAALLHDLNELDRTQKSAGLQADVQELVAWAGVMQHYQSAVEGVAKKLVAAAGRTEVQDAQAAPYSAQPASTSKAENATAVTAQANPASAASAAVRLLQLAGASQDCGVNTPSSRQEGQVTASMEDAAQLSEHTRRLALQYRVNKKRVLWDYLLQRCSIGALLQALTSLSDDA